MPFNLEAENISKYYLYPQRVDVLKKISFSIKPAESIAIMGSSGEGKTTLLNILGLLEKPDEGFIKLKSTAVNFNDSAVLRNEKLGFIFQDYNLLNDFTVLDNITFPARVGRKNLKTSTKRAEKYIELVGLSHRKNFQTKLLSGGEKQRVSIARAFCNDPDIILADEPSGNLDHANSKIIHELLLSITRKEQKSLIIATHNLQLASLCDKSFELKGGILFPLS